LPRPRVDQRRVRDREQGGDLLFERLHALLEEALKGCLTLARSVQNVVVESACGWRTNGKKKAC
jgi:hypothetical protein